MNRITTSGSIREHATADVIEETEELAAVKAEEVARLKTAVERLAELS